MERFGAFIMARMVFRVAFGMVSIHCQKLRRNNSNNYQWLKYKNIIVFLTESSFEYSDNLLWIKWKLCRKLVKKKKKNFSTKNILFRSIILYNNNHDFFL